MLRLICASYTYPAARVPALRDLELTIPHGEILGVVGPNEAGKSTLCLVASGLAPAVIGGELHGTLEIDGMRLTGQPVHEVAQRVGLLFQNPAAQISGATRTVYEEIALGPMNLGLSRAEVDERVTAAIETLSIEHLLQLDPRQISGGQAQLVAVAGLLAMRPDHLILDEPTSQLDPAGTRLVAASLRVLAVSGTALLIVEHKTDLIEALCERVLVMADGQIVRDGPATEILADPFLLGAGVTPPSSVHLGRICETAGLPLDATRIRAGLSPASLSA